MPETTPFGSVVIRVPSQCVLCATASSTRRQCGKREPEQKLQTIVGCLVRVDITEPLRKQLLHLQFWVSCEFECIVYARDTQVQHSCLPREAQSRRSDCLYCKHSCRTEKVTFHFYIKPWFIITVIAAFAGNKPGLTFSTRLFCSGYCEQAAVYLAAVYFLTAITLSGMLSLSNSCMSSSSLLALERSVFFAAPNQSFTCRPSPRGKNERTLFKIC